MCDLIFLKLMLEALWKQFWYCNRNYLKSSLWKPVSINIIIIIIVFIIIIIIKGVLISLFVIGSDQIVLQIPP